MSGFLLDTNVPSEITRPAPDLRVSAWIASHDELHLSVISIGEIRKGIHLLPESRRRRHIENGFNHHFLPLVEPRILPVTRSIAEFWADLNIKRRLLGNPLNMADGLIAATALEHNLALVTRNVKDFEQLGLTILNPWEIA